MKKVWVYLPCYNEALNIIPLVEKWFDIEPDFKSAGYELFVNCIDDKSTDDTAEKIKFIDGAFPEL